MSETKSGLLLDLGIWVGLIVSILAVYSQAGHFNFADYDDNVYVYNNVHVREGLTPSSIKWAATSVVASNWMPVTMFSHLFDSQLFGMRSGLHHLVNVLIHMVSAILLFAVLHRATGMRWPSAFVAFVFAVHPLHVESVAWVAERKDVLAAFFFFLTLYAYVRYTETPTLGRYLSIVFAFGLGLMSKPMLVTVPFTLLLFDVWPLRRAVWPKILWEKLPLFALSACASAMTYWTQRAAGSILAVALPLRVENSLVTYVIYLYQTIYPVHLAVFYPYPQAISLWMAAGALALILLVSAVAIWMWRTRPYFAVGWFWYLGTLVPVIGLVQVGLQSRADRYTYIPLVGLSVMLAWGAAGIVEKWPRTTPAIIAIACLSVTVFLALAWKQTATWQNSETLFERAIEVTGPNWEVESYLGEYLVKTRERRGDAIPHLEAALRLRPDLPEVSNNLGACLLEAGLYSAAIPHFEEALLYRPDWVGAHFNLALALSKIPGREPEAILHYQTILRIEPGNAETQRALGALLRSQSIASTTQ